MDRTYKSVCRSQGSPAGGVDDRERTARCRYPVTWENPEFCVTARPGTAGVVGQTPVRGRVRRLDPAELQGAGRQRRQPGVRVKGHWKVLPVLLPPDDGRRVTGDLTTQEGAITEVRRH